MPLRTENDALNERTCINVKGKGHPMTCLCINRGEIEVWLLTIPKPALKWVWSSAPSSGRFSPGENRVQILREAEWSSGSFRKGVENHTSTGIPFPVRSIAQRVAIPTMLSRPLYANTKSRISLYAGDMDCSRSAGSEITAGKVSQLSEQLTLGVVAVTVGQLLHEALINATIIIISLWEQSQTFRMKVYEFITL